MQKTVTLTASACYGHGGKQYIARITGRNSKFTFAREFVGRKEGKRRESSTYMTDEPGLYLTCDLDSKGRKDETYYVVERRADGGLDHLTCDKEDAMELARRLDDGETFEEAVAAIWPPKSAEQLAAGRLAALKGWLEESLSRGDPGKKIGLLTKLGISFGPGTRGQLWDAIRAEITRLEPPAPVAETEPIPAATSEPPPVPFAFVPDRAEEGSLSSRLAGLIEDTASLRESIQADHCGDRASKLLRLKQALEQAAAILSEN